MSIQGAGVVAVVPVAATVGVALVGAAILAAGVGVCVVAGQGLVAGGRAVHQACERHAAERRSWTRARRAVESRATVRGGSSVSTVPSTAMIEAMRLQEMEFIRRLRAQPARISQPIGAEVLDPAEPLDRLKEPAPPSGEGRYVTELERGQQIDALQELHTAARRILQHYEAGGNWEGLFDTTEPGALLEESVRLLDEGNIASAQTRMNVLQQVLLLLREEAPTAWHRRYEAARNLDALAERLEKLDTLVTEYPALAEAVTGLWATVSEARVAYERLDFTNAVATAASALAFADQLLALPIGWRRETLRHEWQALVDEVAAYGKFDGDESVHDLLAQAKRRLDDPMSSEADLARVQDMLDQAGNAADQLLAQVEARGAGDVMRENLARLATEQLEEMGYTVEAEKPSQPEQRWQLVGRRGEHEFLLHIYHDGTLWYDVTRGYKGAECEDAVTFLKGLEAKGVRGFWDSVYSAELALESIREVLRDSDYYFYEESTDDGVVLTAIGPDGTPLPSATVGWNGAVEYAEQQGRTTISADKQSWIRQRRKEAEPQAKLMVRAGRRTN